MKLGRDCLITILAASAIPMLAGEVAAPTLAKIIRIVASGNGGKAACEDAEVTAELGKLGVSIDPEAKVVWTIADKDVARFAKLSKLVICGQVGQLSQGASIAIVAEGGRPVIYLSHANTTASKANLPDALLKIGKVVK